MAYPLVDKESICQALTVAIETQKPTDHHCLDDTVLYQENGQELEDTFPH